MSQQLAPQTNNSLTVPDATRIIQCIRLLPRLAPNDVVTAEGRIVELRTMSLQLSRPCDGGWLSMRIAGLLSHYYVTDTSAGFQKALAHDWIEILSGLPQWAIEQACLDWLGGEHSRKKPTPGEIVKIARERMAVLSTIDSGIETAKAIVARASEPEATPESRTRVQAIVDKFKNASDLSGHQQKAEDLA